MSFVYAEKNNYCTEIYSDTKATFDEKSKLNWGENTRNAMGAYGIIKTIIVRDNCCISFAGNDIRLVHKLGSVHIRASTIRAKYTKARNMTSSLS